MLFGLEGVLAKTLPEQTDFTTSLGKSWVCFVKWVTRQKMKLFKKNKPSFTRHVSLLPAYAGVVPSRAEQNTCESCIPVTYSHCQ